MAADRNPGASAEARGTVGVVELRYCLLTAAALVGLVVSMVLGGCSIAGWSPGGDEPTGIWFPSCGPADGPAVEIQLSEAAPTCPGERPRLDYPNLRISLYGTADLEPGSALEFGGSVDPGVGFSRGGFGARCSAPDECRRVERGTVRVGRQTEEATVIQIDLRYEDGGSESVRARLARCERPFFCG